MTELVSVIATNATNLTTPSLGSIPSKVPVEDARLFADLMNQKTSGYTVTPVLNQVLTGLDNHSSSKELAQSISSQISQNDPIKNMVVMTDIATSFSQKAMALHWSTSLTSAFVSTTKGLLNNHE
jgi:hypothetical protein